MDSLEREAKERKKKIIALGSLPLCMAFFVWRVQSTTVAAPPPKAPPPSVVVQAAPAVAAAVGPVLSLEKQRIVEVPLGDKDPFIAIAGLDGPVEPPPISTTEPIRFDMSKPMMVTELGPTVSSLPPANPSLNSFGPPPTIVVPTTDPTPNAVVTPVAPPMPYSLSGIVMGNPNVAVLKHYDGSRRIARIGETLDRKFRLITIDETSVVIEGGGESKTLRLGGDTPAPPPAKKDGSRS
jgi:hypothetical protein